MAEADWEYRRRFGCDPVLAGEEQVWLVCDGLDTLVTVTLNGRELGRTDNMYRQYRWEVKVLLRSGDNELAVNFASPVKYIKEM